METKIDSSREEDGGTHTVGSEEVCERSRGIASSPPTGIPDEPKARRLSEEWLISIISKDDRQEDPKAHSKHPIQKVPTRFRENKNNTNHFNPEVVSLGPYHHREYPLDEKKIKVARQFILDNESKMDRQSNRVTEYYNVVKDVIGEAKKLYDSETVSRLGDEAFTCMMLLDGCFLLYFIEGMNNRNINLEVSNGLIIRDMFLLEKQLPFIVLDVLMTLKFGSKMKGRDQIVEFMHFEVLLPMGFSGWDWLFLHQEYWCSGSRSDDPLHLLELLRTMMLGFPPPELDKNYIKTMNNFGSVMELKDAGIMFRKSHWGDITDIRFKEYFLRRLLLPGIVINDATVSQLMNLTAFETSSDTHSGCGVSSYICFLDSLINHAADVEELRSKGILNHTLKNDEEVARLFNEWPIEMKQDLKVYSHVKKRIVSHRHSKVKMSIARWLDKYFGSPWTAVSTVAAVLLLLLTCIQTVFTIFPRH